MNATDDFPVADYARILRLDGKGFVVAGAGYGMGRQVSHALSANGARVVCADVVPERAEAVAQEVDGIAWHGDLTLRTDADHLVRHAVDVLGGIDGLVDIIGLAEWAPATEIDDEMWDRQFAICLKHAVYLAQAAAPQMEVGGTMVFTASASGIDSAPNHAAYGAAKAGLMSWVRSLAVELGPRGIRVNAVAPGAIRTPRLAAQLEQLEQDGYPLAPLGRMGEPDDIAGAILFLSTPLSSYVSGQVLLVDGGVDALFPYGGL